jgi:hypothetical protein
MTDAVNSSSSATGPPAVVGNKPFMTRQIVTGDNPPRNHKIDTNLHKSLTQLVLELHLRALIDGVSSEPAGLLRIHVVLDQHVVAAEGVLGSVHRANPVVGPPVFEIRGEQMAKNLAYS